MEVQEQVSKCGGKGISREFSAECGMSLINVMVTRNFATWFKGFCFLLFVNLTNKEK